MLFTSLEFLFLFLPLVLGVHFLLPMRFGFKNLWLLLASLAFYAWGEPTFVLAMLASIAFNYLMALVVARGRGHLLGRVAFVVAIAGNLSLLGVFKYANFFTATVRAWFPAWQGVVPQTSFLLPIGISFFTFQALSYVIDVKRGAAVQKNPLDLALYIALFPQLVAGPIVRYATVSEQIRGRRVTWDLFSTGVFRFLVGFNKKMLLANVLGEAADAMFASSAPSVSGAWLGAIAYTLQIYFDFSGYSDMAIGLGRMFGFRFLENFDHPYVSRTVTEFWRRWHMSLGSWFRDYVYIPLGGSRVGRARLVFNLAVVWTLTGLWHGANWTFILWGALYGVALTVEKLSGWAKRAEGSPRLGFAAWPLTLLLVMLGWVLFRADTLAQAGGFARALFGGACACDATAAFWWREIACVLCAACVCALPCPKRLASVRGCRFAGCVLQIALAVVGVSCLVMKAHNPFIYFNF